MTVRRPAIAPDALTLSEVGRRLGKRVDVVRGLAMGYGIHLTPVGTALTMTIADFKRLQSHVKHMAGRSARTSAPL